MKRIQQAKAEAKEEIARIDKELGEKFKEYEAETAQSSIQVSHKIKQETIHFLRQMIKEAARHKEAVLLFNTILGYTYKFVRNDLLIIKMLTIILKPLMLRTSYLKPNMQSSWYSFGFPINK